MLYTYKDKLPFLCLCLASTFKELSYPIGHYKWRPECPFLIEQFLCENTGVWVEKKTTNHFCRDQCVTPTLERNPPLSPVEEVSEVPSRHLASLPLANVALIKLNKRRLCIWTFYPSNKNSFLEVKLMTAMTGGEFSTQPKAGTAHGRCAYPPPWLWPCLSVSVRLLVGCLPWFP